MPTFMQRKGGSTRSARRQRQRWRHVERHDIGPGPAAMQRAVRPSQAPAPTSGRSRARPVVLGRNRLERCGRHPLHVRVDGSSAPRSRPWCCRTRDTATPSFVPPDAGTYTFASPSVMAERAVSTTSWSRLRMWRPSSRSRRRSRPDLRGRQCRRRPRRSPIRVSEDEHTCRTTGRRRSDPRRLRRRPTRARGPAPRRERSARASTRLSSRSNDGDGVSAAHRSR